MSFKDKVVVITGGTQGIGLSIINKLLATDVKVVVLFELQTPNSTQVFSNLQKQYCSRIEFYPCDVSNTSLLKGCFDKVFEKYNVIDILINNAGILSEIVPERMIDINYKAVVMGTLMMIERVGKHKGGNGGIVVNIASILGLTNFLWPIYCSSKHAVVSFTRTMTQEQFDKTGVRVMAICPGLTDTSILNDVVKTFDFIDTEGKVELFPGPQSPENVALACIQIINDGKSGEVWVSEEDQPPYRVEAVEDYKSLRIN